MAAVPLGGTVECHQVGDVTVGERRELVYVEDDDKNAALVERKTVVAQVPLEDGRTAVLTGVEYTAVAAPNDQQRNHTEPDSSKFHGLTLSLSLSLSLFLSLFLTHNTQTVHVYTCSYSKKWTGS